MILFSQTMGLLTDIKEESFHKFHVKTAHKMRNYQRVHYFGILKETGREEDREIAGEYR